ncbi:hypothetical protein NE237_028810 [Protea cynaroides]|uniref:Uncharacterized protein n=1 Tax=Protea cynaroides TaxID=273540 RepID=A0A9Q0JVN0_9MAGN|nr:hypothetical protein NE237_028810 [Protea cynaroides]
MEVFHLVFSFLNLLSILIFAFTSLGTSTTCLVIDVSCILFVIERDSTSKGVIMPLLLSSSLIGQERSQGISVATNIHLQKFLHAFVVLEFNVCLLHLFFLCFDYYFCFCLS